MVYWVLGMLIAVTMFAIIALVVTRPGKTTAKKRRERYLLSDTGERLPIAGEPPVQPSSENPADDAEPMPRRRERPAREHPVREHVEHAGTVGRMVHTPDGEMVLTRPPFELRESIFNRKHAKFANALIRRLPPWAAVSARVRLDTVLTPTRPDGRDPADWREWRRRIRVRSIDLLVCDRRNWKPILAVMFSQASTRSAVTLAGGEDRLIDEALLAVGLPLVRVAGEFDRDWPVMRPYVDAIIMKGVSDEEVFDAADRLVRVDQDAAVNLLRKDGDEGWLLE